MQKVEKVRLVELAQMSYMLPRLRGWGESLSRQAGGIGGRGPGETKIETDRRRINDKMAKLRREIKDMKTSRDTKRNERRRKIFHRWLLLVIQMLVNPHY